MIVVTTSQCLLDDDKSAVCVNQGYTSMPTTFKRTITILTLSNNKISKISTNEAEFYPEVTQLDLSYNAIESYQDIRGVSVLRRLKILNLSGNRLLHMNFHVFLSRNTDLKELDVSNNMNMIIKDAPVNLGKLLKISLKNNKMSYLPIKAFKGFSKLEILDITNNALVSLSKDVVRIMPNLKHVYLNGNSITTLDSSLLQISDLEDLKRKEAEKDHVENMSHTANTSNSSESIAKDTTKKENHYVVDLESKENGTFTSDGNQEGDSSNLVLYISLGISILLGVSIFIACAVYLLSKRNFNDHSYNPIRRIRDNYF